MDIGVRRASRGDASHPAVHVFDACIVRFSSVGHPCLSDLHQSHHVRMQEEPDERIQVKSQHLSKHDISIPDSINPGARHRSRSEFLATCNSALQVLCLGYKELSQCACFCVSRVS